MKRSFSSLKLHPKLLNTLYDVLSTELKNSFTGVLLNKKIKAHPHLEIGKSLPIFELADDDGDLVSLKDFRGKYVLVDFWQVGAGHVDKNFPICNRCITNTNQKVLRYWPYRSTNHVWTGLPR